jgi:protein TonB
VPAYRLPSPYEHPPLRRRASGLALALGANLLLILVLLTLGKLTPMAEKVSKLTVFNLSPAARNNQEESRRAQAAEAKQENAPTPKPPPVVLPVKPTIVPPPTPTKHTQPWIEMSHDQMAASDLANLPSTASGSGAGDSEEVGRGPNGEVLYAAEWARRPTDAELGGYLPRNAPDGFGLIACRTIPDNRVDDCIELDQYPHGSHLAAAVRQAAWQFRVRPPRKNGKALIGSWVQIRIDYEHSLINGSE